MYSPVVAVLAVAVLVWAWPQRNIFLHSFGELDALQAILCGAFVIAGMIFHELGHATACRRVRRGVRGIGATLAAGVIPAFYIDLSPVPRHGSSAGDALIAIGGIYFQVILAALSLGVGHVSGEPTFIAAGFMLTIFAIWDLLPLRGQDGFHLLKAACFISKTR